MPEKPEASPDAVVPEEAALNAVETLAPKKRAAHRSRITGLENLPVETSERDVPQRGVSGGEHQTPVRLPRARQRKIIPRIHVDRKRPTR